jgi:hypothetical protein
MASGDRPQKDRDGEPCEDGDKDLVGIYAASSPKCRADGKDGSAAIMPGAERRP